MDGKNADAFIDLLKLRFTRHMQRHPAVDWAAVQHRLERHPKKLKSLQEMEQTGGEPDIVGSAGAGGQFLFCDCSAESPPGRRSLCYDAEALNTRKEPRPSGNAIDTAKAMGISLMTEAQYRQLQELGEFDTKTSSWIATPPDIRRLGGALFGDRRYGRVFTYHNGAQSYYAVRGFRGTLEV